MDRIINQSSVDGGAKRWPAIDEGTLSESGFVWRERGGVKVLVCRELEERGFANGFSTRLGGVSPFPSGDLNLAGFDDDAAGNIAENRRRFLNVFGGSLKLTTVWQTHGDSVKTVHNDSDIGTSEDRADAIISDLTGVLVGVKTADCVPILLGDPGTNAFAAVHAGWRGTVKSIAKKAVAKMKETYDTKPNGLICAIGPAACASNYEIGQEVMKAFRENFAESEKYLTPTREGHALVDLCQSNKDQLLEAGIAAENIFTAPFCTMDRPDLFFSYRLEKKKLGKTGRLLSVIGRPAI